MGNLRFFEIARVLVRLAGAVVPPPGPAPWDATVSGPPPDPTSVHCAHSFFLNAWDRVISGWGYIHGVASYQKSVTLMFQLGRPSGRTARRGHLSAGGIL
jgi:hypothetical protein